MMRKILLIVAACVALCGGSAFAASGVVTFANHGFFYSVASNSCADVRANFVQYGNVAFSCSSDPVVVGTTIVQGRADGVGGTGTIVVTAITATAAGSSSGVVPSDAASLYVVVLAGLLVGVFALGYQNGVTQ